MRSVSESASTEHLEMEKKGETFLTFDESSCEKTFLHGEMGN